MTLPPLSVESRNPCLCQIRGRCQLGELLSTDKTAPSSRVWVCVYVCAAAEDKVGWHGKVLPKDMADSVVRELHSHILASSKRLYPATPVDDAPLVNVRNIRMPSGPSYKLGEKVQH